MLGASQEAATALRQGLPDAAINILIDAFEDRPPSAQGLSIFTRACKQQRRMAFAIDYLTRLQRRHANNADLAAELVYCHQLNGDSAAAGRETLRGLAAHPTHPALNLHFALMRKRAGDIESARNILAAMCRPERPPPANLKRFAHLLTEHRLFAPAAAIWRDLIDVNPAAYSERIGLALCELKLGAVEEATRIAEDAGRHSGGQARHLALVEEIAITGPPAIARRMDELRRALYEAAPPDFATKILNDARHRLHAIRTEPASRSLVRNQSRKASLVCPIHRPRDLRNAATQMQQQDWHNVEAVFAVNSHAITDAEIAGLWQSPAPLTILDCRDLHTLGAVLNRAIARVTGDFIFKIDADDRYFPAYCTDMILQAEYFAADLVEKPGKFRLLEKTGAIVLESFGDIYAASRRGPSAGGSTLCVRRHIFEDIRFAEQDRVSEDIVFHAACTAAGARLALVDPFNYLAIRSADTANHTWSIDAAQLGMLRDTALIGGVDAAEGIAE